MKITTWKASGSLFLVGGLLVLAAVSSGNRDALAQTPLDCPMPVDGAPPAEPRVTAPQVEEGSASLAAFALAVRDQWGAERAETEIHVRCLVRQEGSPWRSGSTYLVQLDLNGRVRMHAKDMSLSGRRLDPVIYEAVLEALGVDPAVLADPAAAGAAFAAAESGEGGAFDVPGVAGASGHAVVFDPTGLMIRRVQLAGFDVGESDLVPIADEDLDYCDPSVTAEDVVDRTTLKAFVAGVVEYVVEVVESPDLAGFPKARIVRRDPEAPWRHDPVYVDLTRRSSGLIVFHGAFPDRFEFRQAWRRTWRRGSSSSTSSSRRPKAVPKAGSGCITSTIPTTIPTAPTSPSWATPASSPPMPRCRAEGGGRSNSSSMRAFT